MLQRVMMFVNWTYLFFFSYHKIIQKTYNATVGVWLEFSLGEGKAINI